MTNNLAEAAASAPAWQAGFCERYAVLMLEYGRWFLLAALIIGSIGAAAAVYVSVMRPPEPPEGGEGGGNALTATIDAVKGLVDSFAKAPTWLAMFGGAILLLWMAGNSVPNYCLVAPAGPRADGSENRLGNASNGGAEQPAGNEADGNRSNSH